MKPFVQKEFAKTPEYLRVLSEIEKTNKCPFCPDHFRYHKKPVLKRRGGWIATESSWPYAGAKPHCLIISEKHKEKFEELIPSDFKAVAGLSRWLMRHFNVRGGGFMLRFGDPRRTGATVRHLHFHVIQPEMDKKTGRAKVINFPIG